MANNWEYAVLSSAAKAAGGPEKYVEMLEIASKNAGRMEMAPWMGVCVVGASALTVASMKVIDYLKKKKTNQHEIELAKKELIKGIKEYDATHMNEGDVEDID